MSVSQRGRLVRYSGRLAVYVHSAQRLPGQYFDPPLGYGEVVRFQALLEDPGYYAIPGVSDFRDVLWEQGILHQVRLKSRLQLERTGAPAGNPLLRLLFGYRAAFENFCREHFTVIQFKLIISLFLGHKKLLEEPDLNAIKQLGILHVFVVSGFHVSVVVIVLHLLFRWWGLLGHLLTLAGLWGYVLLVGLSPPVLRSGLMMTFFYLLILVGLSRQFLNSLGVSALVILCAAPVALYSASFQFTYLCLCAIGLFVIPANEYVRAVSLGFLDYRSERVVATREAAAILRRRVRFLLEEKLDRLPVRPARLVLRGTGQLTGYFLALACCTWFVQLTTVPLSLYYSNLWNWTQGVTNMIFVPLFSLFIPLCLALFLTFWLPQIQPLISAVGFYADFLNWLMTRLEPLSWTTYLPQPRLSEMVVYFILFLGSYYLSRLLKAWWRIFLRVFGMASPLVFFVFAAQSGFRPQGVLQITMLDVGQGESMHIRYPDGSDALLDTGGFLRPETGSSQFVGERLVSRYLWEQRARRLEYVLLSHPHADHIQGFSFVKRVFPVSMLFIHDYLPDYRGPPLRRLQAGDLFAVAGVHHQILHPPAHRSGRIVADTNNASIVLLLHYGKFSMLFTGDINATVERELAGRLPRVTVLKVGHHGSGSSTSDELLASTRPELAFISAGRKNVFGHPSPKVLNRLRRSEIQALSTPDWGTLRLETDGHQWRVLHYSVEERKFRHVEQVNRSGLHQLARPFQSKQTN